MNAADLANALGAAQRSGKGWVCRCPVPGHGKGRGDRNPSLSVTNGDDGRILVHCHAGCAQSEVILELCRREQWPEVRNELRKDSRSESENLTPIAQFPTTVSELPAHPEHGQPSKRWAYRNRDGNVVFYVCRFNNGPKGIPLTYWPTGGGDGEWRWKAFPAPRSLLNLDRLARHPENPVLVVEGEKTADAAQDLFPNYVVTTWAGGANAVRHADWTPLAGRSIVLWRDNDSPGKTAEEAAIEVCRSAGAAEIRVVSIPNEFPVGWDLADPPPDGWDKDDIVGLLDSAKAVNTIEVAFDQIRALPGLLPGVPALPAEMLPQELRGWLGDAAERTQIPLEFIAAPAIVGLSSLVGRKIGIYPKQKDDGWLVVPNLWGMIVGRPGVMKTPAIGEALRSVRRLAAQAIEAHKTAADEAEITRGNLEDEISGARSALKAAVKAGNTEDADRLKQVIADLKRQLAEAEPKERRYIMNDCTTEKAAEVLRDNPQGLLLVRDELAGLLRSADRDDRRGDREFYLESWNGAGGFTYDRIGRGTIHVPALCLAIVGGIQPGKLEEYQLGAVRGGRGDDGLLQRFQLAVWPDVPREWKNIDRAPDQAAQERASWIFEKIDALDAASIIAEIGHDGIPALRFATEAQLLFNDWWSQLERRLRSGEIESAPAFEAHLAKYRSLMPSLALLFHLIDAVAGRTEIDHRVGLEAARLAAEWCEFLEAHARRIYAVELNRDLAAAHALMAKIKTGAVEDGLHLRDVYRRGWRGLATPEQVCGGINVLKQHGIARIERLDTDGRAAEVLRLHPQARNAA